MASGAKVDVIELLKRVVDGWEAGHKFYRRQTHVLESSTEKLVFFPRLNEALEREERSQLSQSHGNLYHDKFHWFD